MLQFVQQGAPEHMFLFKGQRRLREEELDFDIGDLIVVIVLVSGRLGSRFTNSGLLLVRKCQSTTDVT